MALSAFDSFCRGAVAGRFPDLGCHHDLWSLLLTITARKAADLVRRERRIKRGGGRLVVADGLHDSPGREPFPEFSALVADECHRLLDILRDDGSRRVALLRMEGYENQDIADVLDCNLRTLERKLGMIRKTWLHCEEDP